MKKLIGLTLMVWLLSLSGCAITNTYGPYIGKVVEKDTGEPIEGAVVFMAFYSRLPTPGGPTSHYADATEVLTNGQGQFNIPTQRIWCMRPLQYWDPQPKVIIFKPGYGAFPGHRGTSFSPKGNWFPARELIMVELPQLETRDERRSNLGNLWTGSGVPQEKHKILDKMETRERIEIGLKP